MSAPIRIALACAALGFAPLLRSQCPPSLSFFAGAPTSMSLSDDPAVPFDRTTVYQHTAGFHDTAPTAWVANPNAVHFDLRSAMIACGAAQPPDIDALSLGIDFLPIDNTTGEVDVPQNQWALFSFSVSRTSVGEVGSVIRTESTRRDGPGADVFTYVLPGSALPTELVDVTTRAQDSREIDLGDGSQREIDALDQFMPLYTLEPALVSQLPDRPTVLFSVSTATLAQVPAIWWGGSTPSGATILQMIWIPPITGGLPGRWSCPRLFKSFDELGLSASEELDALAVDKVNQRILFSTKTRTRDELLFLYYGNDGLPGGGGGGGPQPIPVTEQGTGDKIEDKADLFDGDDVDAVCGIDPSIRSTPGATTNVLYFYAATPLPKLFPFAGTMQASAFKTFRNGTPRIRSMLVGWPPLSGPGPGWALCLFSPPNAFGPFFPLLGEMRDLAPVFCGDPRVMELAVPANKTLMNFQFDLRWFAMDATATEIYDAHPLRIRL